MSLNVRDPVTSEVPHHVIGKLVQVAISLQSDLCEIIISNQFVTRHNVTILYYMKMERYFPIEEFMSLQKNQDDAIYLQ